MLFNTDTFLFQFFPIVFIGFYALGRIKPEWAVSWLGAASLVFYALWAPRQMPLLVLSIGINFFLGYWIAAAKPGFSKQSFLVLGIVFNLSLLFYFKYSGFFLNQLLPASGAAGFFTDVVLPLGISFYTFTQLAFLVDVYRGSAREPNFIRYGLFVSYFPHLVAGPLFHHSYMMPQFRDPAICRINTANLCQGAMLFTIGLGKKVMLADALGSYASRFFNAIERGDRPSTCDAWLGVIAFSLQIYYDFSGYSDMAIGLSKVFNIDLPINFNSPYKAVNIIDFWRRWHISLSTFLRDYLYIPLGGNRHGELRRYFNILVTMGLGGLWHGAGWTFVIWGAYHGLLLAANHGWLLVKQRFTSIDAMPVLLRSIVSRGLTLGAVVAGWVIFRANSVSSAETVAYAMFNLPALLQTKLFGGKGMTLAMLKTSRSDILFIFLPAVVFLFAKNSAEIIEWFRSALSIAAPKRKWSRTQVAVAGVVVGIGLAFSILRMTIQPTEFLYFQF